MKYTNQRVIIILLAALELFSGGTQGKEEPTKLQKSYAQSLKLAESPMNKLNKSYAGALTKLKLKTQKAGDTDKAVLVAKEVKGYNSEDARDFSHFPELQRLRITYESALPRVTKQVRSNKLKLMKQALTVFSKSAVTLTKEGDLEGAVKNKKAVEEIKLAIAKAQRGEEPEKEEEKDDFENWLETVTFVASSGTTFKYRDRRLIVTRKSGLNEDNKARPKKRTSRIEILVERGSGYIEVAPDRKSASYFRDLKLVTVLRVVMN